MKANNLVAKYAQRLPCGTGYHKDKRYESKNHPPPDMEDYENDQLDDNWLDFLTKKRNEGKIIPLFCF